MKSKIGPTDPKVHKLVTIRKYLMCDSSCKCQECVQTHLTKGTWIFSEDYRPTLDRLFKHALKAK